MHEDASWLVTDLPPKPQLLFEERLLLLGDPVWISHRTGQA
jgi:hypothetical protein